MSHSRRTYLSLTFLLAASLACAIPAIPVQDTGAISTAAAQTVIAGLTQNAQQVLPSATLEILPTPTFTFTVTSQAPAITASPTLTFTPLPIFTATSVVPLMSVSVPTNCRSGPGRVYGLQGALLVGEIAEVYGRDPTNRYWYIRNPDSGAEFCWAWGEYATISGSPLLLPVLTPPPTPTPTMTPTPAPAFDLEFNNADTCSGWWMDLRVKNTGALSFKSVTIEIKDQVTEVELTSYADGFTNLDGCLKSATKDVLNPDDSFIISSPQFDYNPTGHNFRAIVTLCTEKGQKGTCISKKTNFKP